MDATVVRVRGRAHDADLIGDRLWAFEPMAVGEERHGDEVVLIAGFADAATAAAAAHALAHIGAELMSVEPNAWVAEWRRGEAPRRSGRFVVRLPEHPDAQPFDQAAGDPSSTDLSTSRRDIELVIEPGPAFGYGHASTHLALVLLSDLDLTGRHVADVGCGTGVLAVAAALAGAAAPVLAVDIDDTAVEVTRANAHRNAVAVDVVAGSVDALATAVDVVCANMTAGTLGPMAGDLVAAVAPGGTLVLSGMLDHQVDAVVTACTPLREVARVDHDGWVAVRLES